MPHKPTPANPDHTVHLTTPIPGWLKNQLIESAKQHGEPLHKHIVRILVNHQRHLNNQPPLQDQPHNPIQPIINYLTGEKTLQPCGQTTCNKTITKLNEKNYCNTCGIQTP